MLLKEVLDLFELLDSPKASGAIIKDLFEKHGADDITVQKVEGPKGFTDCIKILVKGKNGKANGGSAPTLGIIGRLGGLGARPVMNTFVSDGDGALAALSAAYKLIKMQENGDFMEGDVIIATHICPDAPTQDHFPVPFMDSPMDMALCNRMDVDARMEAILSIDTTKGNRVINLNGIAISNTIKEGYILEVSNDIMDAMTNCTGQMPAIFPCAQQDITPYGNDLHHINSILQPATETNAPVVGIAITTAQPVAGCATFASHSMDVEVAARMSLEVARRFGEGSLKFYDEKEFAHLKDLYGTMNHFQTFGNQK